MIFIFRNNLMICCMYICICLLIQSILMIGIYFRFDTNVISIAAQRSNNRKEIILRVWKLTKSSGVTVKFLQLFLIWLVFSLEEIFSDE